MTIPTRKLENFSRSLRQAYYPGFGRRRQTDHRLDIEAGAVTIM
jgi:hypothetical protein